MQRFGYILILSFLLSSGPAEAWTVKECVAKVSRLFGFEESKATEDEIAITGGDLHPYTNLLESLKLSEEKLETMVGKKLLSLGEGYSDLVPYLEWYGVDAAGLDIWYHSSNYPENHLGRLMSGYNEKFGKILIRGDARDTHLPSDSYDYVVSTNLIDNLKDFDDKLKVLDEVIRLLKVGGEGRILGFEQRQEENLLRLQSLGYGNQILTEFVPVIQKVTSFGQKIHQLNLLVVIKKLGPTERKSFETLPLAPPTNPPPIVIRGKFTHTM